MFNYTKRKTVRYNNIAKVDPKTHHQALTGEKEAVPTLEIDVSTRIDNVIDIEALVERVEPDIREFIKDKDKANIVIIINDSSRLKVTIDGHEPLKVLQRKFMRSFVANDIDWNVFRFE